MTTETRLEKHVAKCPRCGTPHHYTEIKFPMVNDRGSWLVECETCEKPFVLALRNPRESDSERCTILERFDDEIEPYGGDAPHATEVAAYHLDMNGQYLRFAYDRNPIYYCHCESGLEDAALAALVDKFDPIRAQYGAAINQFLARRMPDVDHAVAAVPFACSCGEAHRALFYCKFKLDGSDMPAPSEMLLADISNTDLADTLTGIFSKSYLMDALEKLIARWRLFCDQILIAAPFVGHQYKTQPERLEIWERLLSQLDARRTVFLSRAASYSEYKSALLDSGLDHEMLEEYGLENQIVSAGTKKQDFHAKVYVGLRERCEILSGSANLVQGKSMENASFTSSTRARVEKRYLAPLGVTVPRPPPRPGNHIQILQVDGNWRSTVAENKALTPFA